MTEERGQIDRLYGDQAYPRRLARSSPAPSTPRTVGSPEADTARAEAVTASEEAFKRVAQANARRQDDSVAYNETDALWLQRRDVILAANPQHYSQCGIALVTALAHLTDMRAFVETAFDHMDAGDGDLRDGDALPDPPTAPKVMEYMGAKAHYNAAKQTAGMALAEHPTITAQLAIANDILIIYG